MTVLYSTASMRQDPKITAMEFTDDSNHATLDGTSREPNLPSIVTVALVVQRVNLEFLTSADIERLGTPGLHIAVYNGLSFENSFFSLYLHFGKLSVQSDGSARTTSEDPRGWRGGWGGGGEEMAEEGLRHGNDERGQGEREWVGSEEALRAPGMRESRGGNDSLDEQWKRRRRVDATSAGRRGGPGSEGAPGTSDARGGER